MMRFIRALLGGCVCVVGLLIILMSLTTSQSSTPAALHTLFTQTHNQISHLNSLKKELDGASQIDEKLLQEIGFIDQPYIYPNHSWYNLTAPVITSAVDGSLLSLVEEVVLVAQQISINSTIIIYGIDLSYYQYSELENVCNSSCIPVKFDFSPYPSYFKDTRLQAYRPIIIQELLVRAGSVLWLDPGIRLNFKYGASSTDYDHSLRNADTTIMPIEGNLMNVWESLALKANGVRTWPLIHPAHQLPTAAHTHPDMFKAFHTHKHLYDFQLMSDGGALLIYNTRTVHHQLMKPWVTCALTQTCVSPVGAQDSGCRYDKKPLFRYTGCHLYDTSAFNIALGLMYGPDSIPYLSSTPMFTRATTADAVAETTEELFPKATKVSFRDFNGTSLYKFNRVNNKLTNKKEKLNQRLKYNQNKTKSFAKKLQSYVLSKNLEKYSNVSNKLTKSQQR